MIERSNNKNGPRMCRCQKLDFSFFAFSYANKFEVSFMKNYNYFLNDVCVIEIELFGKLIFFT